MALDLSTLPDKSGSSTSNPYLLLGLQLSSLGLSAGQSIAARRRLQQLRQPIRPQMTRNPLLSQRLAQAQQEAQLGNDLLRREREASTAMALERGRQVASQMGGATYGAMMQNQIAAADRQRRGGLVEDEQLRMQRQGQLDNLIGQQMNEDARLDQMAMQGFGMDMQLYNQRLMMEEANQRQANQNIVGTAAAIGADLPNTIGAMGDGEEGDGGTLGQGIQNTMMRFRKPTKESRQAKADAYAKRRAMPMTTGATGMNPLMQQPQMSYNGLSMDYFPMSQMQQFEPYNRPLKKGK
jgi:hypothetical protein